MKRKSLLGSAIILLMTGAMGTAIPDNDAPLEGSEGAEVVVYKTVGDTELRLSIFRPEEEVPEPRSAIVFFFGGGWNSGTPRQFFEHCKYFASRGMVGISAEYRVKSRHGVTPLECVADAKSAVRWVRAHAGELGVDPDRIAAGGGSAGGHLAACTGVIEGHDEEGEDLSVSSQPNALVLFNPAVNLIPFAMRIGFPLDRANEISPLQHVREGLPPTIIFHGTADRTVPFKSVKIFTDLMKEKGNTCELVAFEGKGHGFFNYERDPEVFRETVADADRFLTELGFLEPKTEELPEKGTTMKSDPKELTVYVGTYTGKKDEGIHIWRLDLETGDLERQGVVRNVDNPAFLVVDERHRFLYAVNELVEYNGERTGAVSAFEIDPETHDLRFLNRQVSKGASPCHITIDETGRCVLVANYLGGNVAVFPVLDVGHLGEASFIARHEGSGPNRKRQDGPHPHSANIDPTEEFVYVPDLGIDKVMIYRLDVERSVLRQNDPPFAELAPGSGPRHMTFHPNGRFAYVINELGNTITAFAFNPEDGSLEEIQTVPTLPEDFEGENTTADIHITPSGLFLYGSNRGHDSLVIYRIDEKTGRLAYVGHEPTQGETPRNFAIDPTGRFLLAANQDSDSIVVFRIDNETGKLIETGTVVEVPKPVCIKMIPR